MVNTQNTPDIITVGPREIVAGRQPNPPPRIGDSRPSLIHDGKLWKPVRHSLYESYEEGPSVASVTATPKFKWVGPKFPIALVAQIVSFFKWANETHKSEAMVRLFLNQRLGVWLAWAFPQEAQGLSVNETSGVDADAMAVLDGVEVSRNGGLGWDLAGSFHSHCNVGAFQSGTDHADELGVEGLHITIGNLSSPRLSIHGRFTQIRSGQKVFFPVDYGQFFQDPDLAIQVDGLPPDLKSRIIEWNLTDVQALSLPEPQPEWVANYKLRTYTRVTTSPGHTTYGGYGGGTGGYASQYWEDNNVKFAKEILLVCQEWGLDTGQLLHVMEIYDSVATAKRKNQIYDDDRVECIVESMLLNNDNPEHADVKGVRFNDLPSRKSAGGQQALIGVGACAGTSVRSEEIAKAIDQMHAEGWGCYE